MSAQILAPGAALHLIDSTFSFTEGASVDARGNVFFTDQPNNNIWEFDVNGILSLYMHGTRRSNGMYFDKQGNLISCADENDELISISKDKIITVLANNYNGARLNGPNDVWVNRQTGGIYITDPYYQRDYWTRTAPDAALDGQKIYFLAPGSKQLQRMDPSIQKPNGIVGSPDARYLYVADMGVGKTFRYEIEKDGNLSHKHLFTNQASDGMTVDKTGNVYLTGKGVTVYNPQGKQISHIDVPEAWTANLCFGGKDKTTLFITASKSFYSIKTSMQGVE